eukprot:scaffold301_cov393-Prasinococcus_capsulatus_cf.AAC.8
MPGSVARCGRLAEGQPRAAPTGALTAHAGTGWRKPTRPPSLSLSGLGAQRCGAACRLVYCTSRRSQVERCGGAAAATELRLPAGPSSVLGCAQGPGHCTWSRAPASRVQKGVGGAGTYSTGAASTTTRALGGALSGGRRGGAGPAWLLVDAGVHACMWSTWTTCRPGPEVGRARSGREGGGRVPPRGGSRSACGRSAPPYAEGMALASPPRRRLPVPLPHFLTRSQARSPTHAGSCTFSDRLRQAWLEQHRAEAACPTGCRPPQCRSPRSSESALGRALGSSATLGPKIS